MITDLWHSDASSVRMGPESAILPALDDNGDKEILMKLNISELISNLRTAFRKADYDHAEEVLLSRETKLKNKIKILTDKLELERMEKMSVQDELRKQCKMRKDAKERYEKQLEALKKDNDLDDEKHKASEFWKKNFEVLRERLMILEKGANFMADDGETEELFGLQVNNDPGVSTNVIRERDMNHVDICDNEPRNITTGLPPLHRKDLKSVNTHLSVVEVTRQSPDAPSVAVIGTSDMEQQENNEVDIDDHGCETITAGTASHRKTDDWGNTHLAVDDDARQSPDNLNTAVLEITTKNAVDMHDIKCGNTIADTSPFHRKKEDFGITHLAVDDGSRHPPDTSNTAVLGASEAKTKNSVDVHDHECGNNAAHTPPSERKVDDCGNTHHAVNDDARQSANTPNRAVLGASEATTEDEVDIHDHECKNIAANTFQEKTDDCGNTHLAVDDDAMQSPDSPIMVVPANASLGSQKIVIDIIDSDDGNDDDDECIASGALNAKKATCDIAAAADDIWHSSISGIIGPLKRKWFPEAGNLFDGLKVDGSDTDDDSSSSTSSLESGINKVQLPSDFLCSISGKRKKK